MAWGLTKIHCNGNNSASTQVQESVRSKQVLPACPPIITIAVKSTCTARRMFVSVIILVFLLAAIYWVSLHQQPSTGVYRRPIRIQPQVSRNTASEQTEAAETVDR